MQLRKNCARYRNIRIERAALWSKSARLKIKSRNVSDNAFQVSEDPFGDVEAMSVRDVMSRHIFPRVDLLKVDIEGSELEVFSSNTEWLNDVRAILIETHDRFIPGSTAAVRKATAGRFRYRGLVGEYMFFEALPEARKNQTDAEVFQFGSCRRGPPISHSTVNIDAFVADRAMAALLFYSLCANHAIFCRA